MDHQPSFTLTPAILNLCAQIAEAVEAIDSVATLPATPHVTPHVAPQVAILLRTLKGEMSRDEIMTKLGLTDRRCPDCAFASLYGRISLSCSARTASPTSVSKAQKSLVKSPKRRKYSPEFKKGAIEQVRQPGISCAQIARELGIGANLLTRWRREADGEGTQAFSGL